MAAIGPNTESIETENGTGIRTATGWTWLCSSCSTTYVLGVPEDAELDVETVLHQLDAMHYCWKKGT